MNNIKIFFLFFLFLCYLLSCYNPSVTLTKNKKKIADEKVRDEKEVDYLDYNISVDEFVYLFFDKSFFIKKGGNKRKVVSKNIDVGNPDDYKALVDWQEENGQRYVRLKNLKTGKEYIVKEGSTTGEVILLERNLFFYKFKIGNSIIKVKR